MVYKRRFHDEESYEIASKHRRQQDHTAQLSPILEIDPCNHGSQKSASDGEGENSFSETQDEERISNDVVNEFLNGCHTESQIGSSGNISSYSWVSSNISDEFAESERAVHLSFFPNYFDLDRVKPLLPLNKIYAALLDHPPRKLVSVGPEYQADVPEWVPHDFKDFDDNGAKLAGTCVVPMPDFESPAFNCFLGDAADNCNCLDKGSIRCVRQHVLKAREKLRENLGDEAFQELGFCEMGEEVANKWSEEEEQAFHEAVLSNPSSQGKNFWEHLSDIFPSRTKGELVSYYFNVFMLWKRAEQNRFDPENIDSDDDEWERSELGIMEEGDNSAVESLDNRDAPNCNRDTGEEIILIGIENEEETNTCKDGADESIIGEEDGGDMDVCEEHIPAIVGYCGPHPVFQPSCKISDNYRENLDFEDESSTLYEYQSDQVDSDKLGRDANRDKSRLRITNT